MKDFSNKQVAEILNNISIIYTINNQNSFKINAYKKAAESIENLPIEIIELWKLKKLNSIEGVGKNIEEHLNDLFNTGKIKHYDQLLKNFPVVVFELLKIRGMGPKTAYQLTKTLKIQNIKDLQNKAKQGLIRDLPGFGIKSEMDILNNLEQFHEPTRFLLTEVYSPIQRILMYLKTHPDCIDAIPLGSYRRMLSTVGDIDVAISSDNPKKILSHFIKYKEIIKIINCGSKKASVILKNNIQLDILISPPDAFGSLIQHFTGSKEHNIHLREIAQKYGYSLSDYGIRTNNKLIKFKTEEELYTFLKMDTPPAELREDTGEIEAALKNKLPRLINTADIKGDLHLHSNYPIEPSHDLGNANFEQIIAKAKTLNYEYIGLSDHSPGYSTHSKRQIIELIKKRSEKIEQIKYSNLNIRVLNLLEIDILVNGELSVPQEGLKLLDGAIAGIHSAHSQDKESITKRLLNACESSYVKIISHPTGRLLNKRESYQANWQLVFQKATQTNTFLEINAYPNRLDLPDALIREALKFKVKFVINTDAHDIAQMENINFGVSQARRGWVTSGDVINTRGWLEFRNLFSV